MKRRTFIISLLSGLVGVGTLSFLRWMVHSDRNKILAQPKFLSLLCDDNTIKMLGRSYLKMKPDEQENHLLLNELTMDSVSKKAINDSQVETAIETQMEKKIVHDFDTDNVVVVQGWVLSVTEARQCAFFSILNQ